ncbi:MAG: hypothetical protein ABIS50_06970 [Luteolibacter sp.]|uniref:hypothetical protein n=1 Tax=Luteolibacter sp. TaxID=1962973 RepID=UPI0032658887
MKASPRSAVINRISECEPDIDPEVARQVGQEILEKRLDPATWATALSASGGEHQEALAAYARIRIQQVSTRRRLRHSKAKSFEFRRVTQCFGVKTVQDLLQRSNPSKQLNFLKPKLSIFTLVTLGIGSAGCVGAAGRLLGALIPERLVAMVPLLALASGIAAVTAAVLLRYLLPKRWIMLGWNTGLHFTCMCACFASLLFGVKLIAHAPPLETRVVEPAKSASSPTAPVLIKAKLKNPDLTALNRAAR